MMENNVLLEVRNLVKWFPIKSSFIKRTVGNVKADRMEDRDDPGPGAHHRVNTPGERSAAGERHINRFARKLQIHRRLGKSLAALIKGLLNRLLGCIDLLPAHAALFDSQLAQLLHQERDFTGLTNELSLGILKRRRLFGPGENLLGRFNQLV